MKKNLVIFDGSNFYHGAKHLAPQIHLTEFNYRKLAELITKTQNIEVEYCVGAVKKDRHNNKSFKLYANQQALFHNLEQQNITIKKGYLLRNRFIYHEKGVDVRIALDIMHGAIKNKYSKCYVISSDTDIIPAILDAKREGKEIIYVGFEKATSRAMQANCSKTMLITKKMIKQCAKR